VEIGSCNWTAATELSGDKSKIMSSRDFTYPRTFHSTKSAPTTRAMRTRNRPKKIRVQARTLFVLRFSAYPGSHTTKSRFTPSKRYFYGVQAILYAHWTYVGRAWIFVDCAISGSPNLHTVYANPPNVNV
jgi:hypothetical protein